MTSLEKYPTVEGMAAGLMPVGPADGAKRGLLQIIWSRRLIVLLTALVLTAAAYAYVEIVKETYMGGARIQVLQKLPGTGTTFDSSDTGPGQDMRTRLWTECEIIRSTQVLNDARNALRSANPPIRSFSADDDKSLAYMLKHITASVGRQDDLITVAFETEYRDDIPRVVDAVVNAYIDFQTRNRQQTTREVLAILQREKSVRDGDLSGSLQALLNFKKEHVELGFSGERGNIIVQRLERLSSAMTEAELALVDAKADYDALAAIMGTTPTSGPASVPASGPAKVPASGPATAPASGPAAAVPTIGLSKDLDRTARIRQFLETKRVAGKVVVSGQDDVGRLQLELNDLQLKLEALKREYASNNPAVQSIEASIKTIRQQIADREAQAMTLEVALVEQQYRSALERRAHIQQSYERQLIEAQRLNQTLTQFAPLESAYDQAKKLVEIIDSQLRQLNMADEAGAINIRKIEPAGKPDKPYKPDKIRVVGIACAVGLLLGMGLALLWDWRDPRLGGADEVSAVTALPVMAMLPEAKLRSKQEELDFGRTVSQFPHSPTSEAFRGLRTTLVLGAGGHQARALLVTSPGAQEGKSTLVSNLAVAMAQAGQRTLVLDADFRQPRQHLLFEVSDGDGLSVLLKTGGDTQRAIHRTAQPGLDVLPAGPQPDNPSELLGGRTFQELVRTLSQQYDQILIDSPPVTAVSDSLILAARSDATLLVVRSDHSHRKLAEEACRALASVGAKMCGVVVNGISPKKLNYGYYSKYSRSEDLPGAEIKTEDNSVKS